VPATVVAAAPSPKDAGGFLTLDTYPWTRVSHNGRVIGTTPLVRAALPAGKQTIVLENAEQGVRQTLVVTIAKGETTAKRVAFK
jgi:serine/threonine-protein kinase